MTASLDALHRIDEVLTRAHALTDWGAALTPLNVRAEFERFTAALRAGRALEPAFEYAAPDPGPAIDALDTLSALDLAGVPAALRDEYARAVESYVRQLLVLRAFAEGDDDAVHRWSRLAYAGDDWNELAAAARAAIDTPDAAYEGAPRSNDPITAQQMADTVAERLRSYGLDWAVVVDTSSVARVRVSSAARQVVLSADARYREIDRTKILAHEIDTHVLRHENGRRLWRFGLFALGTPRTEAIEEGLALANERRQHAARADQTRIVALHVVGIDAAARGGFHETFERVRGHLRDEREAFQRVLRWKRGLRDQARPNAFWKDVVYFSGVRRLADYVSAGGRLRHLYAGRFDPSRTPDEIAALRRDFGAEAPVEPLFPPFLSPDD